MANLNRIILVGRLTADPEARTTMEGLPLTKFRLAVDRPQGGADFIDVVAWRKAAEAASAYLKKGQLALVEGRIQIRSFEDQTGKRRWATEVVARNVRALDKVQVTDSKLQVEGKPETEEETIDDAELESDLPF